MIANTVTRPAPTTIPAAAAVARLRAVLADLYRARDYADAQTDLALDIAYDEPGDGPWTRSAALWIDRAVDVDRKIIRAERALRAAMRAEAQAVAA